MEQRKCCCRTGTARSYLGDYLTLFLRQCHVEHELKAYPVGVAAACAHLRLVHLGLQGERRQGLEDLTPVVVESITAGQAAKTLTHITIKYAAEDSLRAVDLLRLVTGCPKLEDLNWIIREDLHDRAELDEAPLKAIEELLESRGGNTACYAIGEWNEDELDPDCIFE